MPARNGPSTAKLLPCSTSGLHAGQQRARRVRRVCLHPAAPLPPLVVPSGSPRRSPRCWRSSSRHCTIRLHVSGAVQPGVCEDGEAQGPNGTTPPVPFLSCQRQTSAANELLVGAKKSRDVGDVIEGLAVQENAGTRIGHLPGKRMAIATAHVRVELREQGQCVEPWRLGFVSEIG